MKLFMWAVKRKEVIMSKYSRKHYEDIARILGYSNISHDNIVALCGYFKSDNRRFDVDRFMRAFKQHRINHSGEKLQDFKPITL